MTSTLIREQIDRNVGRRLYRRRRLLGLTMAELGRRVGCKFQQIGKYESGANRVTASRLYQLAEALGVNPNYFFEGVNDIVVTKENLVDLSVLTPDQQIAVHQIITILKGPPQCPNQSNPSSPPRPATASPAPYGHSPRPDSNSKSSTPTGERK